MLAVAGAEEVHVGVVDEVAGAVEPGHPHQHRGGIGDAAEARLAFLERALGGALLGDVLVDDDEAVDFAVLARPRHVIALQRRGPPARMVIFADVEDALAGQRPAVQGLAVPEPLGADDVGHPLPDQLGARPLQPLGERLVDELHDELAAGEGDIADHHRQHVGDRQHGGEVEPAAALRGHDGLVGGGGHAGGGRASGGRPRAALDLAAALVRHRVRHRPVSVPSKSARVEGPRIVVPAIDLRP